MRGSKKGGKPPHLFTNIVIIGLIVGIYLCIRSVPQTVPAISSQILYHGTSESSVALQFKLNWNPTALSDILSTLKSTNVHATFFVSGEWSENNPELLQAIATGGHEIGTMGYYAGQDGGVEWLEADIKRSTEVIERITGERCQLYFPDGRQSGNSIRAAKRLKLKAVSATVDLLTARGSAADVVGRLPSGLRAGTIILMSPTRAAAEALPEIISSIVSKSLSISPTGMLAGVE